MGVWSIACPATWPEKDNDMDAEEPVSTRLDADAGAWARALGFICFVWVWLVVLVVSCLLAWHFSVVVASFLG